jgi:hypothetical protein
MMPTRLLLMLFISLSLFLLLPQKGFSETQIYLKDGRVLKVDNFWREEGMVKYQSFGGTVGIPSDEVEKIVTPDMVAYEEVRKTDTIEAYQEFLRKYPKSDDAADADLRVKALQFEKVKEIDSGPVYLDYIRRNPTSVFVEEAKERAEVLIFQNAVRSGQRDKYKEYLDIYPEGRFAEAARKGLEYLDFQALRESGSIPAIEAFLQKTSEPSFHEVLEGRLATLQAKVQSNIQQKKQQQEKAQRIAAEQAQQSHSRWTLLLGVVVGIAMVVILVVFFLWKRKRKVPPVTLEEDLKEAMSEMEGEDHYQTPGEGVRYEDLVGVPKKSNSMALPDPAKPAALPEPEVSGGEHDETDEEEDSPFLRETAEASGREKPGEDKEDVIALGFDSKGQDGSGVEKDVVDLSDPEGDFKLELEEDPPEKGEKHETTTPITEEMDRVAHRDLGLSGGDFPDFMDDEERKKKRGGGEAADGR